MSDPVSKDFRASVKARALGFGGVVGWKIFPVMPSMKNPPLVKWGTEATNDVATIERMWTQHPGANIGLACGQSNIAVIDVDVKNGKRGQLTLDMLDVFDGVILPPTRIARTWSGGLHYYFTGEIATTQNVLGRHLWDDGISHIDTRGTGGAGGYVLLPPSRIAGVDGKPGGYYTWLNKLPIARLPDEIAAMCASAAGQNEPQDQEPMVEWDLDENIAWSIDYLTNSAPIAVEGEGGERCTLLIAGTLKDHGISEGCAVELMQEHYNDRCIPSWDADELRTKVANAYLYLRQNRPGERTAWADFMDVPAPSVNEKEQALIRMRNKQRQAEREAIRRAK